MTKSLIQQTADRMDGMIVYLCTDVNPWAVQMSLQTAQINLVRYSACPLHLDAAYLSFTEFT